MQKLARSHEWKKQSDIFEYIRAETSQITVIMPYQRHINTYGHSVNDFSLILLIFSCVLLVGYVSRETISKIGVPAIQAAQNIRELIRQIRKSATMIQ